MQVQVETLKVENVLIKFKDLTVENEKLKEACAPGDVFVSEEEVEKLKGEIKKKDEEMKALMMTKGGDLVTNNKRTPFVTNEMRFTEGVRRFIEGLNTKTNLYPSYESYYKAIFEKMTNNFKYFDHNSSSQEFQHGYNETPFYQFPKHLFIKIECQKLTHNDITFDISSLEYEEFAMQQRSAQQREQKTRGDPYYGQNQEPKKVRKDRLVESGWSHSGCTVLLLHRTDPMKCVQFSPQFVTPYPYNTDDNSRFGKWKAKISVDSDVEYLSPSRELYRSGSKIDLFCYLICCIKH